MPTDADGDTLTLRLQFASDENFTQDLQEFTGASSPISFTGIPKDTWRYVRVAAFDGKATTYGGHVLIRINDRLEFKIKPLVHDSKPVSVRIKGGFTLAEGATLQSLKVCNNAKDASPVWEDMLADYTAGKAHEFTNESKTDTEWAFGAWVVILAGTATGNIEARALGYEIIKE
jgi:hypothetical protein